jgi:hypothetical protein
MLFYRDCSETWRRSLIARRELAREQTVLTSCAVRGPVFEEDEPRVKNVGIDEFEARPWIAGIDRLPASGAEDHGKDHEPEPVDKSKLHHAPHETDAANRSKWISRLLFECPNLVRNGGLCQAGVLPGKRLLKRAGEYQLGEFGHSDAHFIGASRREPRQGNIGQSPIEKKDVLNPFTELTPLELCEGLKIAVLAIHAFWSSYDPNPSPIRASDTPGRNDPCPCGSGKKYKRCCGRSV